MTAMRIILYEKNSKFRVKCESDCYGRASEERGGGDYEAVTLTDRDEPDPGLGDLNATKYSIVRAEPAGNEFVLHGRNKFKKKKGEPPPPSTVDRGPDKKMENYRNKQFIRLKNARQARTDRNIVKCSSPNAPST